MLHAYAQHLKQAPYRASVLGVRLNFNALGTEHTTVLPEDRDPARWRIIQYKMSMKRVARLERFPIQDEHETE